MTTITFAFSNISDNNILNFESNKLVIVTCDNLKNLCCNCEHLELINCNSLISVNTTAKTIKVTNCKLLKKIIHNENATVLCNN